MNPGFWEHEHEKKKTKLRKDTLPAKDTPLDGVPSQSYIVIIVISSIQFTRFIWVFTSVTKSGDFGDPVFGDWSGGRAEMLAAKSLRWQTFSGGCLHHIRIAS